MKKPASSKLNRQILDEASEWFVDFRVGDVDAEARARFDEWLRRSPEHIRAYWEIAKTYVELPPQNSVGKLKAEELIAYAYSDANVIPFDPRASEPQTLRSESADEGSKEGGTRQSRPRLRRPFFAAASVAFALVIAGAVWWQVQRYPLYATDIGERRSITLADGSTVDLNACSQLRVEFTNSERRVELLDGQALFQVAKDKARPFIVHSGAATVRAVGTQFDVYRRDSGTTITVLEGRVAVYSGARTAQADSASKSIAPESNVPPQPTLARASRRNSQSGSPAPGASVAFPSVSDPGLPGFSRLRCDLSRCRRASDGVTGRGRHVAASARGYHRRDGVDAEEADL
jgi:transmembrane sensor